MAFLSIARFSHFRTNQLLLFSRVRCASASANSRGPDGTNNPVDPKLTVWWDSSCPLCLREIQLMKKWASPGTVAFIDIGSPSSAASCPIDRRTLLARFHAQERNGPLVDGAQAFTLLYKHIPQVQRLGLYLSQHPRALNAFEWFYTNFFLPYLRPTLQKSLKLLGLEGKKSS